MAEMGAPQLEASGKRCPALVIMVGAPGSGKSFLGRTISVALGARLLQTDAVRKEMFPEPRYSSDEAAAVYAVCHRRIAAELAHGASVVFDGTNLREHRRQILYHLAAQARAALVIVVAYASESTVRERLRQRAEGVDPQDQSDATWQVYQRMRRDAEPVPRPHIMVNTAVDPAPVIRLLRRELGR